VVDRHSSSSARSVGREQGRSSGGVVGRLVEGEREREREREIYEESTCLGMPALLYNGPRLVNWIGAQMLLPSCFLGYSRACAPPRSPADFHFLRGPSPRPSAPPPRRHPPPATSVRRAYAWRTAEKYDRRRLLCRR
jgi:hypothetical protein